MIKLSIAILLSIFFCEASFPAVSVQLNSQIKCYLEKKPALRPQSDGFSLENAHTLAVLSLISYAQPKMAMASALQIEGLTKAKWITSRKSDTQAMWLEGTEVLALIFRGTEVHSRLDIQTDLMALSEGLGPIGKVHVGFNHAFNSVWKTVLSNFNEIKQIKPLLITGHSLGAALATLAATQLLRDQTNFQAAEEQNNEWNKPFVQGLYTYGSPRVGDRDFAIRFDYLVQKSRMYTLPGLSDKPKTYSARLV
ncbi:MAG: lipase family protein, partial [Pseudomonadota bacterium]